MSDAVETVTPAVDESFEAYFSRANVAEKTGALDTVTPAVEPVTEPVETDTPPVEAVAEKPKGKPRNDPQARIDEITAKQKEAERKAQEADAKAARLEAELAAARAPKPAAQPVTEAVETFPEYAAWAAKPGNETKPYEDYIDARTDWRYDQRQRADRESQAEMVAIRTLDASNAAFRERLTAAIADEPDFLDTVDSRIADAPRLSAFKRLPNGSYVERGTNRPLPAPTFANFLSEQVFKSESPKAVLRHLSNVQEVQRLATLPPDEVIRVLARLDTPTPAAAERGPAQTPPKSQAPAPVQPLGSSASVTDDGDEADLPVEAFIKKGNARDRKAGRL
jgi:hypothetical protein